MVVFAVPAQPAIFQPVPLADNLFEVTTQESEFRMLHEYAVSSLPTFSSN